MKVRTQGQVVKMVVILVEEEKMREILVVVVGVVDRSPSPTLPRGGCSFLLCLRMFERCFPPLRGYRGAVCCDGAEVLPPFGEVRGGASTSSSNSVGVAISQPRVAGEARYPG